MLESGVHQGSRGMGHGVTCLHRCRDPRVRQGPASATWWRIGKLKKYLLSRKKQREWNMIGGAKSACFVVIAYHRARNKVNFKSMVIRMNPTQYSQNLGL